MTIRRHVDLTAINSDYMEFETGVDAAPEGMFSLGRNIKFEIGEACDDLLRSMRRVGAPICNCDGIREIEALMFDAIRRNNPASEIETLIGLGRSLDDATPERRSEIIAGLERGRDTLETFKRRDFDALAQPGDFITEQRALEEGEGDLWEVRVVSSADESDSVDFNVRAPTMGEAADRAEAHARKHASFYFENAEPTYHADRRNIYRVEEDAS